MADPQVVARVRSAGRRPVERLVPHPRLPLVAGLEADRPAVHVWDCGAGRLREVGGVGTDAAVYAVGRAWERRWPPAVAWHPDQPVLVVGNDAAVVRWTRSGASAVDGVPPTAAYRYLAFSPDGGTLWASPSSGGGDLAWQSSDVLDLASGAVGSGSRWDTGIVEHPGRGVVATLVSDQGATYVVFARTDLRVLRRALILDADGYEAPIFSADGGYLAIRGDAYSNSLKVFEFPALRLVLETVLGEPTPAGDAYPPEWLEQLRAWSRHNVAFGPEPGALWVGTPTGTLVEVDVRAERAVEHVLLGGVPVTALCALATGELVVAGGDGDLLLLTVGTPTDGDRPGAAAEAFLRSTSELPDGVDLDSGLVVTDGTRAWIPDDLAEVTAAAETDPSWLRFRAMLNDLRAQEG